MKKTFNAVVIGTLLLASASVFAAHKEVSIDTNTKESSTSQGASNFGQKVHQLACKVLGPLGLSGCKGQQ
jgi:hypothetical protein